MNKVVLIGRLTKDPDMRFAAGSGLAVVRFNLAVNRQKQKDKEQEADFISCIAFGKTGETIAQYITKGGQIAIEGHIQTGSYDAKNGTKKYTTDVIIDRFEFCGGKSSNAGNTNNSGNGFDDMMPVDDGEIPF